jgi:hypothetical protein
MTHFHQTNSIDRNLRLSMNVLAGFLGSVEETGPGSPNASFVAVGRGYVFFLSQEGFCLPHQTLTLDSFSFGLAG